MAFRCYECVFRRLRIYESHIFELRIKSLLAVMSTLSSIPSFVAMFLFSEWMARVVLGCAFLLDFVIFCLSRSLYVDGSSL